MVLKRSSSAAMHTAPKRSATASARVRQPPLVAGRVLACGSGECGQLGLGDEVFERARPAPVVLPKGALAVEVAVGGMHTVAIAPSGTLYTWGNNDQHALGRSGDETVPGEMDLSMLPEGVRVAKAVLADSATVLLASDGHVWICGTFRGADGIIGATKTQRELPTLQRISSPAFDLVVIVDVASGSDHFLALDADGRVWTWGNGQQFQLGHKVIASRIANSLEPRLLALRRIITIGAGSYTSFAIDTEGTVFCWGLNNWHQAGLGLDYYTESIVETPTASEVLSKFGSNIQTIAGGEHHSVLLTKNGEVYAWGRAGSNQLGVPLADLKKQMTKEQESAQQQDDAMAVDDSQQQHSYQETVIVMPVKSKVPVKVSSISVGSNHVLAIGVDGITYSWGFGETNALGHGGSQDKELPTAIDKERLQGLNVIQVAAGGQHSVFLGV